MNNIEEMINHIKSEIASDNLCGHDELTVSVSDLSALIAQLEAAQKEPKETQEDSDIPTLRSEAASIIGLLTAEGHQTFSLDKVADFFDDVFRKFELAEAALSAANEKLSKPVVLPDYRCSPDMHTKQYYETIGFNLGLDACKAVIKTAGGKVEGE